MALGLLILSLNATAEGLPAPSKAPLQIQSKQCELAPSRFHLSAEHFHEMSCAKAPSFLVDLNFRPFNSVLQKLYLDAGDQQYKKIQKIYQLMDFVQDESHLSCPQYSVYLKEFKESYVREYNRCRSSWEKERVDLLCSEILRIQSRFVVASVSDYWLRNYEQSVENSKSTTGAANVQTAPPVETESALASLGKWCESAENLQLNYGPFGLPDCSAIENFLSEPKNQTVKPTLQAGASKNQKLQTNANPFPENLMFYSQPYLLKYCQEPESRQTSKILNFHCRLIQ